MQILDKLRVRALQLFCRRWRYLESLIIPGTHDRLIQFFNFQTEVPVAFLQLSQLSFVCFLAGLELLLVSLLELLHLLAVDGLSVDDLQIVPVLKRALVLLVFRN